MLKSIKKIKKFGIFNDYNVDAGFNEFSRFNLFYGWNGCGKTTLSRVFGMLDKKLVDPSFTECEFDILLNDGSTIKANNLASFNTKVFVFNQVFIEENIDWKTQGAKTIVVISEDKINERKLYFDLKDVTIPAKQTFVNKAQSTYDASVKERDEFLTSQARAIKQSFQFIDTNDSRYMNYDRTKIRAFIDSHQKELAEPSSILTAQQLEELRKKIQPIQKQAVTLNFAALDKNAIIRAESGILEMLSAQVVNETILRLKNNEDINKWVQEGVVIHEKHSSETCEYCGQAIPAQRLQKLQQHFSEAYTVLLEKLRKAKEWLGIQITAEFPDPANIYDEFKDEYNAAVAACRSAELELTQLFKEWEQKLNEKSANVFDSNLSITEGVHNLLNHLENARNGVSTVVSKHNKKSNTFETQLRLDKERIELHFVAEAVKDKNYYELAQRIENELRRVEAAKKEVERLIVQKIQLEGELANAQKGADHFNTELHKFLGRSDISLQYDATAKGYKIVRTGTSTLARNLSEGEKTAIAFVYFTIKLKEGGNKVNESIVVVDDPISSFDSNYLFHSFSYLKNTCEEASQLFVLTHNFQYFKLVRDWMLSKNKSGKPIKSQIYSIDVVKKDPRQSILNNAHDSLLNHNSEYQFFFKKLHSFKDLASIDLDNAFEIANYARKMLEAFFSFKHPKGRDNFYQLMKEGCSKVGVDQNVVDRVYKFINNYSHHQVTGFDDSSIDNILSESDNITQHVLDIMSKADKVHYDEMVEICGEK